MLQINSYTLSNKKRYLPTGYVIYIYIGSATKIMLRCDESLLKCLCFANYKVLN